MEHIDDVHDNEKMFLDENNYDVGAGNAFKKEYEDEDEDEEYGSDEERMKLGHDGCAPEEALAVLSTNLESVTYKYSESLMRCFESVESMLQNMQDIAQAEDATVTTLLEQAHQREQALQAQLERSRNLKARMAQRAGRK